MKALKNKSGISLVFVLASMLLLMALGVSALTAAGLSFGVRAAQANRNQLDLYHTGMERTIRAAMLASEESYPLELTDVQTIGGHIVAEVFTRFIESVGEEESLQFAGWHEIVNIVLENDISAIDGNGVEYVITIEGFMNVETSDYVRRHQQTPPTHTGYYDGYGEPIMNPPIFADATQWTAYVWGEVTVTQITKFGSQIAISTTVYRLSEAVLAENASDLLFDIMKTDSPILEDMYIVDSGQWEVVSHAIN